MKDINLGYALFLWSTEHKGCSFCSLKSIDELCPKECIKDGYYKILMDDELRMYLDRFELKKNHPNFGRGNKDGKKEGN